MVPDFDSYSSIAVGFFECAKSQQDKALFSTAEELDQRSPRRKVLTTFKEAEQQVRTVAGFLFQQGFKSGDRVAVISNSRAEWLIADLAVLAAGGVVVSVYQSLTAVDIGFILHDAEVSYVFVENQEQLDKVLWLLGNEFDVPATEERASSKARVTLKRIIAFEEVQEHPLVSPLRDIVRADCASSFIEPKSLRRDDLATLVYTSGTSGPPKGVMQTHGNHLANLRQALQAGMYNSQSSIVIFLPLAHSFARLMAYIGCLAGPTLHFPAILDRRSSRLDQKSLVRDIGEANATIVPVVPRILEKMKSGIEERARSSGLSALIVRLVLTGIRARVAELRGEPRVSRLGLALYRGTAKIRRGIVRKLFGVDLVNAISGGAKLADGVNYFFEALGAPVLQGYGLTETCVATNVNRVASNRIGTVGPVLAPDIELRIAGDGEILFRGPNIALGYLNRTKATLDAWDLEGWFHTGDVGALSADGYLSITGRKKELIVTAGGKKIAPESVEMKLKTSAVFSQVVLAGEAKPYCVAIVTLNPAVVQERLGERVDTSRPLSAQDTVRDLVDAEIVRINTQLASFETVKRALIVDEDFTIDNGFLTPTLKVKRMAVIKRFQDQIDRLYQNSD